MEGRPAEIRALFHGQVEQLGLPCTYGALAAAAVSKKDWLVCLDILISEADEYTGQHKFGAEVFRHFSCYAFFRLSWKFSTCIYPISGRRKSLDHLPIHMMYVSGLGHCW